MTRLAGPLLLLGLSTGFAAASEPPAWVGEVRTGTILAGEEALFSYELRQSNPAAETLVRELLVCRSRGDRYRLRVTRRRGAWSLEMGDHSPVRPIEPEVFIGPVPTKDAEIRRDPKEPKRFVLPMTKLRAGPEELEFSVQDVFVPTVQRWLEETWRGTSRDLRQALNDVLAASASVPFGMGEDLVFLVGLVPTTELKVQLLEAKFRREERSPDFCAGP